MPRKLFMFYVGGDCGNSNIELHDVRFSLGTYPRDCYDDLREQCVVDRRRHAECLQEEEERRDPEPPGDRLRQDDAAQEPRPVAQDADGAPGAVADRTPPES